MHAAHDDRNAAEVAVGLTPAVKSGCAHIHLKRRVTHLHDVVIAGVDELRCVEIPVDETPAAGAQPKVDGGRVDDDIVVDGGTRPVSSVRT